MDSIEIEIETGDHAAVTDITDTVARFCRERADGLVSVFVPHATAGLAIIETGAGSDIDLIASIDTVLPAENGRWRHDHGSPGHGRDHVLPAYLSPSVTVPVIDGSLMLGTWQSITLVDTNIDNTNRTVRLSFIAGVGSPDRTWRRLRPARHWCRRSVVA